MKGLLDRTKVALRHLPPTISQSSLVEQIDSRFSERYNWLAFRPGKLSLKRQTYSRACINFNTPDDVVEFAEFFNGHVFVNEKGTQFKTVVEYAPSQRVPKQWSKNDGREGTILKDPEYLEFLEFLAKPVENLPSAEIQLERKEAERAGAPKDIPIVTPLMNYVRQKRAAKGGARRCTFNGKPSRRVTGMLSRNTVSGSSKKGFEKKTTTMYVLRDSSTGASSKDKSTYILASKQDEQQHSDKSVNAASRTDALEGESGGSGSSEIGKKKILLLKGKEKEIPNVSGGASLQRNAATLTKNSPSSTPIKQNQRREASGRIIRSILVNKDSRPNQLSSGSQSENQTHTSNQDRDKKPPRPPQIVQSFPRNTNGVPEDKVDSQGAYTERQERRTRNRDRPDRGVWAPLRRSDESHASDESLLSSSQTSQGVDSAQGIQIERKNDMLVTRGGEYRSIGGGRGSLYSGDNGSYRHGARRGSVYNIKDLDGSSAVDGKPSKRGGSSGYGSSHDKQMWVQKSSPGS